jgi:hypothetical protein
MDDDNFVRRTAEVVHAGPTQVIGVNVGVILTRPYIFFMDSRYCNIQGGVRMT